MDNLDFTEDEIQHQLVFMGYENIPKHRLSEFKKDLDDLIRHGELKNLISLSQINSTKSPTVSRSSKPPAFTKEKVSCCCLKDHDEGFLHARDVTHDKHVRNASENKEYGQPQGHGLDSYVRHSVAPKLFPPPGLPQQLQIEADASKLLCSSSKHPAYTVDESVQLPLTGMSSADTQRRPVIKRKVLRKHKGQTLVCDESISTEDSALRLHRTHHTIYKMYAESDDDDKNSLNSSFWSDGEPQDEEEVKIERLVEIEALRSAEEPLEASGEEKSDLKVSKVTEEGSGGTDGDDEDEESCSSCDSPVLSFMTSGYGTYRPEEQEAGDCTSDCVDQDSRGHLSELRDDEDDHCSVCSNIWFEGHGVTFPQSLSPEPADPGAAGGAGEMIISEEEGDFKDEGCIVEDRFMMDEKIVEGGNVDADHHERPEEKQELKEAAESNESPCDQNIRFIDSKVDFSQDCERSLRQTKGAESRLEERLSELCLSAQHDSEAESEEARSRSNSSGSEASSSDIFESYVRGLTRGDVKVRSKPKSFIRPVVNQRMKKTDPVAKYFHYKRLWDVFKLPGEVDRTALRLEIKERLAYQPPPPKPRRVYMPNTYIVPTEKKRSALRWEIRTHLANEMIPYKCGY